MSDKNLFQRIIEVRKAVGYIQKDKAVSTGGGSYKAVTHDAVTGMVREAMNAQGIVCVPTLVTSLSHQKEEGQKQYRYDATYDFTFVNADKPEDNVVIRIEAHAMDNADKAPGKAISYAKKYAVLKLFEIETGEDEESRYEKEQKGIGDAAVAKFADLLDKAETYAELNAIKDEFKTSCEEANDTSAFKVLGDKFKARKKLFDQQTAGGQA